MQQSLTSKETKMDTMCTRMDSFTHKLEKQDRIAEVEQVLSTVEETVTHLGERLNIEKILKFISEENLRILGISESTNIDKMEDFVECLLTTLFGAEPLSKILIVERAHNALLSCPPPRAPSRLITACLLFEIMMLPYTSQERNDLYNLKGTKRLSILTSGFEYKKRRRNLHLLNRSLDVQPSTKQCSIQPEFASLSRERIIYLRLHSRLWTSCSDILHEALRVGPLQTPPDRQHQNRAQLWSQPRQLPRR
ncbi:hypothetical protein NDU88_003600 [Pleurodeles waltl]|uniref:Uncharacterized protein n=1 Tax=Pleurodeles waltl TaxID=8319 RepID=A0AAV7M5U4_PLEWA|nr:hypothetical protein NDU88_003600 [Pleurodeles waltl]